MLNGYAVDQALRISDNSDDAIEVTVLTVDPENPKSAPRLASDVTARSRHLDAPCCLAPVLGVRFRPRSSMRTVEQPPSGHPPPFRAGTTPSEMRKRARSATATDPEWGDHTLRRRPDDGASASGPYDMHKGRERALGACGHAATRSAWPTRPGEAGPVIRRAVGLFVLNVPVTVRSTAGGAGSPGTESSNEGET